MIEVKRRPGDDPLAFEVTIRAADGETRHRVTMSRADAMRLGQSANPERCVEAAFRFLLDREPKDSILARFDIAIIKRYFPEFEREFPRYLAPSG